MSINEIPSELIILICNEAIHEDNTNKEIKKCKKTILDIIAERNLIVLPVAEYFTDGDNLVDKETDSEIITDIVSEHIASLSKTQKDTILCDYGIFKALKLYRDFHVIGCGCNEEDIAYNLTNPKYSKYAIDEIITLIINDEISYDYDWRKNNSK